MNETNTIKKFEVGKTYTAVAICDSEIIYSGKVVRRTAMTVTFDFGDCRGIRTIRINKKLTEWKNGVEGVYPFGQHSMCPIFYANEFVA